MRKGILGRLLAAFMAAGMLASVTPVTAFASPLDVETVNTIIAELPEREDMTEEDYALISEAMEKYNSLSNSEKLGIENYEKLESCYNWAVQHGFIKETAKPAEGDGGRSESSRTQDAMPDSGKREDDATQYLFTLDDKTPTITVRIHYTTDRDGDGNGDIPSLLNITSPTDKTYSLIDTLNGTGNEETVTPDGSKMIESTLKSSEINMTLLWMPTFLQIDIAKGPKGKWMIMTSDPVYFEKTYYAGARLEIEPEEGSTKTPAETESSQPAAQPRRGLGGLGIISIAGAIISAVLLILIKSGIFQKSFKDDDYDSPSENKKKKKKAEAEEAPEEDFFADYGDFVDDGFEEAGEDPEEEEGPEDETALYEGDIVEKYVETGNTGLLDPSMRPADNNDDPEDDEEETLFKGF